MISFQFYVVILLDIAWVNNIIVWKSLTLAKVIKEKQDLLLLTLRLLNVYYILLDFPD